MEEDALLPVLFAWLHGIFTNKFAAAISCKASKVCTNKEAIYFRSTLLFLA